jgi:hypothetical protein
MNSELAPTFAPFIGMVSSPNNHTSGARARTDFMQGGIAAAMIFGCTSEPAPLRIEMNPRLLTSREQASAQLMAPQSPGSVLRALEPFDQT